MKRKALVEKMNELKSQMQNIVDSAKVEKRALNADEISEFDNLENEIKAIKTKLEREDNSKMNNTVTTEDRERFISYVRSAVENRAAGIDVNLTAGENGAIIPTSIANKIITKAYDMSSVLKSATKYNTKGNLSIPVYGANGESDITMAYADEFTELESKIGKFTSVNLGNHLAGALALISKSLIANTDIDLEAKIVELMAEAISRFMEGEIIKGTNGKVTGLKDVTQTVTAAAATAITAAELVKLKNSVKKQFRAKAKWIMSNDTLTAIELLKDQDDRLIFHDDMKGEFDGYILGYPVEVSDNMPEMGAGKTAIYFGDFSGVALKQRSDALELDILREKYATQHAVGVNAWVEFDAKVEHQQKLAKLVMANA